MSLRTLAHPLTVLLAFVLPFIPRHTEQGDDVKAVQSSCKYCRLSRKRVHG